MRYNFDYAILEAINNAIRTVKAAPMILGGVAGSGGGVGGPPGGYLGYLPQYRVALDLSEEEIYDFPEVSGSLLDNLNRIRYRIRQVEDAISGGVAGTFIDLLDTPDTYTGNAGKAVIVNDTEDGLVFSAVSISGTNIIHAYNENLQSQLPGSGFVTNQVFIDNTLRLYYNGVRQTRGIHYIDIYGSGIFTTMFSVDSDDTLVVDYDIYNESAVSNYLIDDDSFELLDDNSEFISDDGE